MITNSTNFYTVHSIPELNHKYSSFHKRILLLVTNNKMTQNTKHLLTLLLLYSFGQVYWEQTFSEKAINKDINSDVKNKTESRNIIADFLTSNFTGKSLSHTIIQLCKSGL